MNETLTFVLNNTLGGGVDGNNSSEEAVEILQTHKHGLTFREDGMREPPKFTELNNVIIIVVGLSILILPVVGFLVCMCARSRFLGNLRGMKLISEDAGDGSGLPYTQFDSEEDYVRKPKKQNLTACSSKDVRVLLNNDNIVTGTPTKNVGDLDALTVQSKANQAKSSQNDLYATLDVDATFVLPSNCDNSSSEISYS